MKMIKSTLIGLFLTLSLFSTGQSLVYELSVAQLDLDTIRADVLCYTQSPNDSFRLSSGQFYVNYNSVFFGPNVLTNNRVFVETPDQSILGSKNMAVQAVGAYQTPLLNDNTDSRLSVSFFQLSSGICIDQFVTSTPKLLVQLFFVKDDNALVNSNPDLCFEDAPVFTDQTFTVCGPSIGDCVSNLFADCINEQGTQILNDQYLCSISLPIELLTFSALLENEEVQLNWSTQTEINSAFFEIEHSPDGNTFKSIGRVVAAGRSVEPLDYSMLHPDPVKGNNYYRLRLVDLDATWTYSSIEVVKIETPSTFQLFPNPVDDLLILAFDDISPAYQTLKVFDLSGKVIHEEPFNWIKGNSTIELNTQGIQDGCYLLRLEGTDLPQTHKFCVYH